MAVRMREWQATQKCRYALQMTREFWRVLEAVGWFVLGFVTHMLLLHYHHHPFR
jgi:hypothetical protein